MVDCDFRFSGRVRCPGEPHHVRSLPGGKCMIFLFSFFSPHFSCLSLCKNWLWVSTNILGAAFEVFAWAGTLSQEKISCRSSWVARCEVEVGWWSPSPTVSDWQKTGSLLSPSTKPCPLPGDISSALCPEDWVNQGLLGWRDGYRPWSSLC